MSAIRHLLIVASVAASLAAQTRLYVDPVNGSNANSGAAGSPLQSLTVAVTLATANTEIVLMPGVYSVNTGETFPITLGNGAGGTNMVIRGLGGVVFDLQLSTVTALRLASGATGTRITNVTFFNADQTGWWTRVIDSGTGVNSANAANQIEIDRCQFVNVNRGMVLWTADNCTGWKVHDCLFSNLTNDAILEYTGTNNEFFNNTFHTNLYKAYISDSATSLCYNNLIVNNAIAFECNNTGNNPARFQNNWLYNCPITTQGAGIVGQLPPSNLIGVDPMLVSATDFHLQANSPCLDYGNPGVTSAMDLDGVSRAVDGDFNGSIVADVGCYEVSPVAMTARFDPTLGVLITDWTRTNNNVIGFVLFAFNDGVVTVPNASPILVSPTAYVGHLWSPAPTTWYVNLNAALPFIAGTRIVNHVIGFGAGPTILGGNQVWTQF